MMTRLKLAHGADRYLLPGLKAAWGASLDVTQAGVVTLRAGCHATAGDPALLGELKWWLEHYALARMYTTIGTCLLYGALDVTVYAPMWVYDDRFGLVVGFMDEEAGHFEVAAWLVSALPRGYAGRFGGADLLMDDLCARRPGE